MYNSHERLIVNVIITKSLYGLHKSALLLYKKPCINLRVILFKSSPYDAYAAKKIIYGSLWTMNGHVDDLKILYVIMDVITNITT